MIPPRPTCDEKQRLEALRLYDVLDTPPEPALDDLTALAAQICGAPIALISLVDEHRQWFKSRTGLETPETPRDVSFCGHAIQQRELFTVPDATRDERFADNPLVTGDPHIRFYAGSPLLTPTGHAIGSLCVIDHVPRQLDSAQEQALRVLGRQVIAQMELRRHAQELSERQRLLHALFERYRHFVESLPVAAYTTDAMGRITLFNAAAVQIWGRPPGADARWCGSYKLYDAEGTPTPHDRCPMARAIIENRAMEGIEMAAEQPDGTRLNFMAYATPFRDSTGHLVGAMNAMVDITERKRAEVRINHLNRVYAVLSAINQTIVRDREPKEMLTAACRVTVETGGFLLAWVGLISPDGQSMTIAAQAGADEATQELLEKYIAATPSGAGCAFTAHAWRTGSHAVCNDIARDPDSASWREAALARGYRAMISLPLGTQGKVVGVFNLYGHEPGFFDGDELRLLDELSLDLSFALEIHERETARKRAEQALQASEERFRQLAENIQEVFWITDPTKQSLLYISPAYAAIWGRSCESLHRDPIAWITAIHAEDRPRVLEAAKSQQALGTYDEQYRIQRPDGTLRWIRDRAVPVRNQAGEVYRIVGVATDITRQRQLEEEFRQSQKMEAIGQLAGGVAHDFNNILSAIMMQTDLALLAPELGVETHDLLSDIKAATSRAANLTRQLLAFSRRQVMQSRLLDLNEIVTHLTKMLQRILGEDVRLQLNLHSSPLITKADAGMLDQVLLNLVVNARDAMPAGGRLHIETALRTFTPEEAQRIPDARPGAYACLRVTDTGTGIAPEIFDRIFEPFFTTKDPGKGTGLGLATVFGIVKQHEGALKVESTVGSGTTFHIFLPVAQAGATQVEATPTRPRGGTETILLVEDDSSVRLLTRRLLERQGYRVTEARHGVEALKLWQERPGKIDLLLTDIVMPEGVSGRQLAERLQATDPRLRVIFTSGYSSEIAGRELVLREGQNFLQKPCPPDQLLKTVRACLDA